MTLNYFTFLSQTDPTEIGYHVQRETDFDYRFEGVCRWGKMFMTYGDGSVQHSKETVFQRERFADFIGSLAVAIAETEDAERRKAMLECVAKHWPRISQDKAGIRFALSLKRNEKRDQWYCLQSRKVSTASAKAHDKRWEKIDQFDDCFDGSIPSAARILKVGESYDFIEVVQRYTEIQDVFGEDNEGSYRGFRLWEHLKIEEEDKRHRFNRGWVQTAWDSISMLVQAYRLNEDGIHRAGRWKECGVTRKEAISA